MASGQSKLGRGGNLAFGRSPGEILFWRPSDTENRSVLQILSLSGAPPIDVPDSEQIERRVADPQTGLWIGSLKEGDRPEIQMFSADLDKAVRKIYLAFPGKTTVIGSWSTDFTKAIVSTSGSGDSGSYYFVDLAKGKADLIGNAYPTIGPDAVGPIRMIDYRAADGFGLHGVLSLPPGRPAVNLPLVVIPHDGVTGRGHPDFHPTPQAFASRGYAVLEPNPRGSAGYDARYREAGRGELGRKMQTDLSDGVAELVNQGVVDPKRVCIVGSGWGGYAALAGVTVQQGIYRCSVSIRGVADLERALGDTQKNTGEPNNATRSLQDLLGATATTAQIRAISPARLAAQADAPVLLIYNKDDPSDPGAQSREMEAALKRAGKPVELLVTSGLKSGADTEANRVAIVEHAITFVETYNPAVTPAQ